MPRIERESIKLYGNLTELRLCNILGRNHWTFFREEA